MSTHHNRMFLAQILIVLKRFSLGIFFFLLSLALNLFLKKRVPLEYFVKLLFMTVSIFLKGPKPVLAWEGLDIIRLRLPSGKEGALFLDQTSKQSLRSNALMQLSLTILKTTTVRNHAYSLEKMAPLGTKWRVVWTHLFSELREPQIMKQKP